MEFGLGKKTALVGGASQGLGFAVASRLAGEGCRVVMCSRGEGRIGAAAAAIRKATNAEVLPVTADLASPRDVERLLAEGERFGGVDILFTNTGGPPSGAFDDCDDRTWEAAFQGLLMSVVRLCRGVLPGMRQRHWGRIINNTSFTVREPAERLILSNVLRVGVVALGKSLSREVAGDGITVNTVCPGAFGTERLQAIFERESEATGRSIDAVRASWKARIPIGRLQSPEELAAVVAFLASEQAAAITGTCIPVDGGMLRGLF